jgi:tripartite-type tricarboxylate transporter receptor subunit TctC
MNLILVRRPCSALSGAVLVGGLLSNQALTQGFYQGKTVTIMVGTDAGGGFDN